MAALVKLTHAPLTSKSTIITMLTLLPPDEYLIGPKIWRMAWVVAYPTLVKVHTTVMRPTVSHIPVDIIP